MADAQQLEQGTRSPGRGELTTSDPQGRIYIMCLLPYDDPHTVWLHLEELLKHEYPSCTLHLIDKDKNLVSITYEVRPRNAINPINPGSDTELRHKVALYEATERDYVEEEDAYADPQIEAQMMEAVDKDPRPETVEQSLVDRAQEAEVAQRTEREASRPLREAHLAIEDHGREIRDVRAQLAQAQQQLAAAAARNGPVTRRGGRGR